MPLRCINPITSSSVQSFDLSADDWRALTLANKNAFHLRMPCCSSQVILKRSRRGTQFFAHKAVGGCATALETEEHRLLKQIVVGAARSNGWEAQTEVVGTTPSGEQWKADVLAQNGKHKVAVEIQWSRQTNEETMRRQARYSQSGVRCLWLLRQRGFPVDHSLPAARIGGSREEGFVALVPTGSAEQSAPMRESFAAAFSKRLRFGVPLGVAATVSIRAGHMFCWSCGAQTRIITGIDVAFGPHEYQFSLPFLGAYPDLFEIARDRLPSDIGLGPIKTRFSKTQEQSYLSNGCAHCGAFIGEFYEHDAWADQEMLCAFQIRLSERWRQAILRHDGHEGGWGVYSPDEVR